MKTIKIYKWAILSISMLLFANTSFAYEAASPGDDYLISKGYMVQKEAKEIDTQYHYMQWQEANNYCNNLELGGYDDWMLPANEKVMSLFYEEYPELLKENDNFSSCRVSGGFVMDIRPDYYEKLMTRNSPFLFFRYNGSENVNSLDVYSSTCSYNMRKTVVRCARKINSTGRLPYTFIEDFKTVGRKAVWEREDKSRLIFGEVEMQCDNAAEIEIEINGHKATKNCFAAPAVRMKCNNTARDSNDASPEASEIDFTDSGTVNCQAQVLIADNPEFTNIVDIEQKTEDGVLSASQSRIKRVGIKVGDTLDRSYTNNGTYTIAAVGKIASGDGSIVDTEEKASVMFKIDTTNPAVDSLWENKWYSDLNTNFQIRVKDQKESSNDAEESGIASVSVASNGKTITYLEDPKTQGVTPVTLTLNSEQLKNALVSGVNILTVTATDVVGHVTIANLSVNLDNTSISAPVLKSTYGSLVENGFGKVTNIYDYKLEVKDDFAGIEKVEANYYSCASASMAACTSKLNSNRIAIKEVNNGILDPFNATNGAEARNIFLYSPYDGTQKIELIVTDRLGTETSFNYGLDLDMKPIVKINKADWVNLQGETLKVWPQEFIGKDHPRLNADGKSLNNNVELGGEYVYSLYKKTEDSKSLVEGPHTSAAQEFSFSNLSVTDDGTYYIAVAYQDDNLDMSSGSQPKSQVVLFNDSNNQSAELEFAVANSYLDLDGDKLPTRMAITSEGVKEVGVSNTVRDCTSTDLENVTKEGDTYILNCIPAFAVKSSEEGKVKDLQGKTDTFMLGINTVTSLDDTEEDLAAVVTTRSKKSVEVLDVYSKDSKQDISERVVKDRMESQAKDVVFESALDENDEVSRLIDKSTLYHILGGDVNVAAESNNLAPVKVEAPVKLDVNPQTEQVAFVDLNNDYVAETLPTSFGPALSYDFEENSGENYESVSTLKEEDKEEMKKTVELAETLNLDVEDLLKDIDMSEIVNEPREKLFVFDLQKFMNDTLEGDNDQCASYEDKLYCNKMKQIFDSQKEKFMQENPGEVLSDVFIDKILKTADALMFPRKELNRNMKFDWDPGNLGNFIDFEVDYEKILINTTNLVNPENPLYYLFVDNSDDSAIKNHSYMRVLDKGNYAYDLYQQYKGSNKKLYVLKLKSKDGVNSNYDYAFIDLKNVQKYTHPLTMDSQSSPALISDFKFVGASSDNRLKFTWSSVAGASYYELWHNGKKVEEKYLEVSEFITDNSYKAENGEFQLKIYSVSGQDDKKLLAEDTLNINSEPISDDPAENEKDPIDLVDCYQGICTYKVRNLIFSSSQSRSKKIVTTYNPCILGKDPKTGICITEEERMKKCRRTQANHYNSEVIEDSQYRCKPTATYKGAWNGLSYNFRAYILTKNFYLWDNSLGDYRVLPASKLYNMNMPECNAANKGLEFDGSICVFDQVKKRTSGWVSANGSRRLQLNYGTAYCKLKYGVDASAKVLSTENVGADHYAVVSGNGVYRSPSRIAGPGINYMDCLTYEYAWQ
jgi:hypothetical protein